MNPGDPGAPQDRPGFGEAAREVFWAFLGVRDHAHYARAARARPWQLILAGLLATAGFIGLLLFAVHVALRTTGGAG